MYCTQVISLQDSLRSNLKLRPISVVPRISGEPDGEKPCTVQDAIVFPQEMFASRRMVEMPPDSKRNTLRLGSSWPNVMPLPCDCLTNAHTMVDVLPFREESATRATDGKTILLLLFHDRLPLCSPVRWSLIVENLTLLREDV